MKRVFYLVVLHNQKCNYHVILRKAKIDILVCAVSANHEVVSVTADVGVIRL